MRFYNSLTKGYESLPSDARNIKIYSCGVTVYDKCHIGHARSLYTFDALVKYLRYRGFAVKFVRNITDVDDKIIAKAHQLGRSFEDVVKENIDLYYQDMASLGIDKADVEPRATENIDLMIEHIKGLIQQGHAYVAQGDVYFRVRSFETYGKLSGQSIDKMLEGVRVEKDEKKQDPLDFALWKASKAGEPSWMSPWGLGRPGWHIECSCMSMKHLQTQTVDIHAGGRDLIFPHHENEIAQAEALTKQPFAKMWIHHGLLTIDGQKMSKSLGNFITIQDALKKHSVSAFKMFFLSTHYASSIDYTQEKLSDMQKGINRLKTLMTRIKQESQGKEVILENVMWIKEFKENIIASLDDDFNTAAALGYIFELVNAVHRYMDQANKEDVSFKGSLKNVESFLQELLTGVFGLDLRETKEELSDDLEKLLLERAQARQAKDWKRSDVLRDILKQRGVLVEDSKQGQTWKRISGVGNES